MKNIVIASLTAAGLAASAQATLITGWNFNSLSIASAGTPAALGITSINSSAGVAAGTVSLNTWGGTIDDFGGSTVNQMGADPAGASLSLIGGGPAAGPYPGNGTSITFTTNLTGYENPIITFATRGTDTGFNSVQLSWSTDGTTFTSFGLPYNGRPTTYFLQTFDLSSVNALDNVSSVTFRLTFSGATSNSGNNRIDNLQINATVPTPGAAALMGLGMIAAGRRRRA